MYSTLWAVAHSATSISTPEGKQKRYAGSPVRMIVRISLHQPPRTGFNQRGKWVFPIMTGHRRRFRNDQVQAVFDDNLIQHRWCFAWRIIHYACCWGQHNGEIAMRYIQMYYFQSSSKRLVKNVCRQIRWYAILCIIETIIDRSIKIIPV